ncbi:MAG: DUF481 domain-containing protein [Candidatus Kapabacteria bacterium]|nr:DUF481 domain-containing protein [Candidatus Kapabacteria bacterium]
MPRRMFITVLLLYSVMLSAQTAPPPAGSGVVLSHTTQSNLSLSQQQVNDWKEGDKTVLDLKSSFRITSQLSSSFFTLNASVGGKLGITRDNSIDTIHVWYKTTDNDLNGEAKLTFPLGFAVDPFISASFKTQITESQRLVKSFIQRTANLWDPVTSDQSMGFTYRLSDKSGFMSLRSGVALQQIRAAESTTLTDNPKTPKIQELYKATAGMECVVESQYKIDSLVSFTGKWNARKNIITDDAWQLTFENEFRIKIWKYVGIVVTANLRYDEAVSKRVQFKQSTMFGFLFDL